MLNFNINHKYEIVDVKVSVRNCDSFFFGHKKNESGSYNMGQGVTCNVEVCSPFIRTNKLKNDLKFICGGN